MFSTQDRAAHAMKRKRAASIFSPKNVSAFEPRIQQHIWKLCQQCDHKCNAAARGASGENWTAVDARAVFECTEQFAYLTFDVIGDLALGSSFGLIESQRENIPLSDPTNNRIINIPIVQVTHAIPEVATTIGSWPAWLRPLVRVLPWNYSRSKGIYDFGRLTVAKFNDKIERTKKFNDQLEDSRPMIDLIDKLLELKDENGAPLSRKELLSEALLFLFAGGDTTSNALSSFCYLMAIHTEVQRKLQVELDEHIPLELEFNQDGSIDTPSDVVANYEHVKNLPYLNACVKEVMRLQSVTGIGLPRVVPPGQTFTFKGQVFKEGSIISVPSFTINRMDVWGSDAEIFTPERWLGPESTEFSKYYSPFSFGNRVYWAELGHHAGVTGDRHTSSPILYSLPRGPVTRLNSGKQYNVK